MRIKYGRTGQQSIKKLLRSISLHRKKHFFLDFFLKKALDELYLIILKLKISKNDDFFLPWMIPETNQEFYLNSTPIHFS